ncbi:hypothetical protein VKS41_009328 [Umbelopsis sp. WA50703]
MENDMAVISGVKVHSYDSRKMKLEKLISFVLGLTCTETGKLYLALEPGWHLKQVGPIIKPPIRWVRTFEKNATFDFECYVKNDSTMQYMPGREVQPTCISDKESFIFFGNYPENA